MMFYIQVTPLTAEEPELQKNRLALLNSIAGLFGQFADFSKLAT